MSQPTLNALNNTNVYLNEFKNLDKHHLGYLDVGQVKDYFKSQHLPEDDLIELASHSNQGRLTPEQFASVMNLAEMKQHGDVGYHSSKFSSLLRHCEEAMKLVEEDRRMEAPSSDNKNKLLKAFEALEGFMKQFIQSLDEKPQDNERSLNGSAALPTFEKMPGSFDFDNAPPEPSSMQTTPAAAPISLKDPSFGNHPESPHVRQNEKEPALDSPSLLPQMNDAAAAFMSGSLKPTSNRNLNGDDAKPNNAHENDTLRSNVLDSLRNAAMNDTESDEDDNKEKEILSEEEPHERAIRSAPSTRGITSDINVKPSATAATTTTPSSFSKQPNDTDSKPEPTSVISGSGNMDAEDALVPLAASVATVAAATAAAAAALSDNSKSDSYSSPPLDAASTDSYAPETFQGGLGGSSSEPFIKNAKDTELIPEDQPSFGAEQTKLNMLDGTDADAADHTNDATAGSRSVLPKLNESNQCKPFESEAFRGGLGGNGTEPYIKNEKDTLLKPGDQPSFGAEQERLSQLNSANEKEIEPNDDMELHQVSKTFANKGPQSFQGGLGGDGTEPYIKNEKDTLLRPEDQPSFGAEQEKLMEAKSTDDLKDAYRDTESSPSLGSTLSKIGAGAAGIAGAAAWNLSEQHDSDKNNKDTSIASSPFNDVSSHNLTSPHSVYLPSLTSSNSLQDANPDDVISNEALDTIADKVDADIKQNHLQDDTTATDSAGIISSDALDKIADNVDAATENNAVPSSVSTDVSPQQDVHVLVEQDTSLPTNIDNEVKIATANNDSNRSPLLDNATISPAVFGKNTSGAASPGLNNDYTGGSSTVPDSTYHAPLVKNTAESRSPALDTANTPHVSSLSPKDVTKDASSKDSANDDADSKEEKPGFFKRLFGSRSKSPEPASKSMPTADDKSASKESSTASPPADSKDASTMADARIVDRVHAFNIDANADLSNLSNNTLQDMLPNVHGDNAFIKSPESNVNVPSATFNSNVDASEADIPDTNGKLNTPEVGNDMKSPGFNTNINVNASSLSSSLEKLSADINDLSDNVSSNFDGSVGSPDIKNARLPSLDTGLSGSHTDLPNVDGKLDDSINMPDVGTALPSLKADMKTPNPDKPSLGSKLSGSMDTPDIDGKLSSVSPSMSGSDAGLPNLGGELDGSISTPKIDSSDVKPPGFSASTDLGAAGLSGSLGSLSAGLKDLKNDVSGSVVSPKVGGNLPSLDADLKSPSLNPPNVDAQLDGSMETPSADMPSVDSSFKTPAIDAKLPAVDNDVKSPSFNADVNTDRPDLTGSLGKLSSSFKNLKNGISGSMDTSDIDTGSPSLHADLEGPNVELPHIDDMLPSVDADVKAPKLDKPSLDGSFDTSDVDGKLPSINADVNVPNADLPKISDKHDRSISGSDIDGDVESPSLNANMNTDDSGLSGSLGKLSAGLKSLKDNIVGKFEGSTSTPDMDSELPDVDAKMNTDAELLHIDAEMPSVSSDLEAPKLDESSIDSKLTGSMDTPNIDGKRQSLDAGLEGPEIAVPSVSGTLDRSFSAPDANIDTRSPGFDASMNADASGLSGSLGKLSAGWKDLKDDISGKLDGSLESPNIDSKAPTLDVNMKGPSANVPNVGGELDSSFQTPDINEKLPSLSSDINTPSVDMPNVGSKLDGSVKTPDLDAKIPSVDGDLKSPALDANAERPDLSGSLGKLSSSFKGLKDGISGKLSGETPSVDGELPSFNADLKRSELFDVDKEIPSLDTDVSTSKLGQPSLGGDMDTSLKTPDIHGKLPSVDADVQSPAVNFPTMSGKFDRSISTPDVKADLKTPEFDSADVGLGATGVSASLGKLSAGLKGLKSDISSKFDGSVESPDVDGKLPDMDVNLNSSVVDLPKVGGEFDGSMKTPDMDGKLPLQKSDMKDLDAGLPHVDTDFNGSVSTPNADVKLPSVDAAVNTPNADVDASRPSLSGSLGKLSSSLKDFKKDITGTFNGSVDAPEMDGKLPALDADVKGRNVELPDVNKELPSLKADIKGSNVDSPDIHKELPSLKADIKGPAMDSPDIHKELPSLEGSVGTPDLDGKFSSLNTDIKSPDVDLPNVNSQMDGSVGIPEIDAKFSSVEAALNTPNANLVAGVDSSRPSLSGSLGKLSSSFKDLKKDISGTFSGSVDTPEMDSKLPTLDADVKGRNVELPDIHKELPSLETDLKTPTLENPSFDGKLDGALNMPDVDAKLPSVNADIKSPQVDLPNLSSEMDGSASTPDINAKLHSIEGELQTPDVNVDASRPSVSGLGKLSSSFKGLKDSISGKFNGSADSPQVDGELPSLDAELPDPNGKRPDLRADVSGVKFGMPAIDGKMTNYIDPPTADAKLPALDADFKGPDVDIANADRSINGGIKSLGSNANVDMDTSSLSGSLGKLSAGLKDLQSDITSKSDSPNMDGKLPTLDGEFKAPSTNLPNVSGKIAGSVETPNMYGKLPSLSSDLKTPSTAGMPHVDANLDGAPDIHAKLPSLGGDIDTPDVNVDADVDASRPSLSGTLGKLSSSFRGLKDSFSGKLSGDVPHVDGELPSVNADLERPNVDLPDVDGKAPLLDTDVKSLKLEKPSLDGSMVGSLNTPSIDGKLPSVDTDVKAPNVDLPHVSGQLDRSISAPNLDSDMKLPDLNANVNLDASGISGKLDGSCESPSAEGKLPTLGDNLDGPSVHLPGNDGKLDGSIKIPHYDGMLPSLDTNVKEPHVDMPDVDGKYDGALNADRASPNVNLPNVSGKLDTSIHNPTANATLPSTDSDMKSPQMNVDANVDAERPGLSGALGKLSSSFKGLKDDITGVFGSSADARGVDVNTDYTSPKFGLPDADLGLDDSVEAPKMDVNVPELHSPNLNAPADGSSSSAPVAPPRKIELLGSLGKMDADVPQMDVPVAPPRSPRLSLNKLSSDAPLDGSIGSSKMNVDPLETSSGFNKSPTFNVHVNGKPALESDLSTGLHRTAAAAALGSGDMSADKTTDAGLSSSKSTDNTSENDDDTAAAHSNKTAAGYAHLRTRSRTENPEDLSAMLDDIVKRRFSNTPSESDVSSIKSEKKTNEKKPASTSKSRQMNAGAGSLSAGVAEPRASIDMDRPRSGVSDSRFKELDEQEGDATEYSTPLASPVLANTAAVTVPMVALDKMNDLESDVEKQLDAMSVSVGQAPQVPAHKDDQLPSPSKTHRSSASLQSTSFHDRSAADAIKSVYEHMTSKLMTGGPKSGNGSDEDRVLKVRDGFENFNGFGVKCVSDNEDEEKHTAPPSSTLK